MASKSARDVETSINAIINADLKRKAEHERLRSAVVSAAQKWRKVNAIDRPWHNYDLVVVVDALNKFEAEHHLKEE